MGGEIVFVDGFFTCFIGGYVIAETACVNSKIECHNHFREVTKMVTIGSSAERGMFTIIEQFVICWVSVALSPRISHQKKISKRLKDALLLKKKSWHRIRVFLKNNCYGLEFITNQQ